MVARTLTRMSVAEYLARERESEIKHEYVYGEVFEMPGVKRNHSRLEINLTLSLGAQLDPAACEIHSASLQVGVDDEVYYYPDLSVVCGVERLTNDERTLLNPTLVVEITSPSSITRDRGEKLAHYKLIPSLEAFLIIDQQRLRADLHTRELDGWRAQVFTEAADVIQLPMLNCELPLDALYRGVELDRITESSAIHLQSCSGSWILMSGAGLAEIIQEHFQRSLDARLFICHAIAIPYMPLHF